MIPDFGESDVLHFHVPLKEILSTSLKKHQWPVWTPLIANGFPILAEGQIGTFYLPNLLLYRFLPTVTAFNLNLVISFFMIGFGTYIFVRSLHFSRPSSTFAAIVFTFSGYFSVHLNHYDIIQTASLFPLLAWAALRIRRKPSLLSSILFGFILSQQIFCGYVNIVFISLVGIFMFWSFTYVFYREANNFRFNLKRISYAILGFIIAFLLGSIQLFPTIELWQLSQKETGLNFQTVTNFPYPAKHLLTFLNPYLFGNPADGSYPMFSSDWGIFWENTAYIGILPLILAGLTLFFIRKRFVVTTVAVLFLSLLLVLGKYSPFYFVFSIPPFNFFRVPSKFLLLVAFSLTILSAYTFDELLKAIDRKRIVGLKTVIVVIFFLFILLDEYRFSYQYPATSPSSLWTTVPETLQSIKNSNEKIISIGAGETWNNVFLKRGWNDIEPYVYFRNSLYPNYNALFSVPQVGLNMGGLIPRRIYILNNYIKNIKTDKEKNIAIISTQIKNLISLYSVRSIISAYPIDDPDLLFIKKVNPPAQMDLNSFYLYQNQKSLPVAYISYSSQKVSTVEDIYRSLSDSDFLDLHKILIEDDLLDMSKPDKKLNEVNIRALQNTEVKLETNSASDGILVLTGNHYPGWTARIDDKPVKIYTVNLSQKGIYLPKGQHEIYFRFNSRSFEFGKKITVYSSVIIFLIVFLFRGCSLDTIFHSKRIFHYHPYK